MQQRVSHPEVREPATDIAAVQRELAQFIERAQTLADAIEAALDGAERELAEIRRAGIPGQTTDAGQRKPAR